MPKRNLWLRLFFQSLGSGVLLTYFIHIILKTALLGALEYAGIVFLLLALVFFMTPSLAGKNKKPSLDNTSYVFIFGLTGFLLLSLPLLL